MAWTLFRLPSSKKAELDTILRDDQISRQSQKVRDAMALGGPSGEIYVLVDGAPEAVARAEGLLAPLGQRLTGAEAESIHSKFREEDESASAGMGLFFTE
jgi:hypothetical protein